MKIIRSNKYNPKLDYLVCKNLLNNIPFEYDELSLRDCFNEVKMPTLNFENDIIKIKHFFEVNDPNIMPLEKWYNLFCICQNKNLRLSDDLLQDFDAENILSIKPVIKKAMYFLNENELITLIKLILLKSYIKRFNELLIPYGSKILKIINATRDGNNLIIQNIYKIIIQKTQKYYQKHSVLQNKTIREKLLEYKAIFLQKFDVEKFGIYGSFACHEENEYSDLDIIVFVKDDTNAFLKKEMIMFWIPIIKIPIDLKLVTDKTFISSTTIGIRKTMQIL